jgi:hypothetical protein
MYRQKDRYSLIVCLASVLELDRPVEAIAEDRKGGERWSFNCCRSTEQWKVTAGSSKGVVFGHNSGIQWSFYDTRSCTHIEVIGGAGSYRVWDYGGIHPVDVTFLHHTATLSVPSSRHTQRYQVEA